MSAKLERLLAQARHEYKKEEIQERLLDETIRNGKQLRILIDKIDSLMLREKKI